MNVTEEANGWESEEEAESNTEFVKEDHTHVSNMGNSTNCTSESRHSNSKPSTFSDKRYLQSEAQGTLNQNTMHSMPPKLSHQDGPEEVITQTDSFLQQQKLIFVNPAKDPYQAALPTSLEELPFTATELGEQRKNTNMQMHLTPPLLPLKHRRKNVEHMDLHIVKKSKPYVKEILSSCSNQIGVTINAGQQMLSQDPYRKVLSYSFMGSEPTISDVKKTKEGSGLVDVKKTVPSPPVGTKRLWSKVYCWPTNEIDRDNQQVNKHRSSIPVVGWKKVVQVYETGKGTNSRCPAFDDEVSIAGLPQIQVLKVMTA